MEGIYKVNLVPSDYNTEETILQIADTLDNLNGIVDDVFARLMTRIKQNMDKTVKLKDRIAISRNKVEKLTGMQKAIKVFSSAKYPASITHEHYRSIFDLDGYQHKPQQITLSGKTQGQSIDKGIQEKLHFYHVKVAAAKDPPKKDFDLKVTFDTISTIGELLIFNTDESPYFGPINKVPSYVPKVSSDTKNKSLLEAAPSSIMKREVLKREVDEYMYAPGMGKVPELEMPLDLPHLPGIAGDIQYTITTEGSIAPSVVTSPVSPLVIVPEAELPELPDLKELPDMPPTLPDVPVPLPDTPDAPPALMGVIAAPPPPPPPPPPPLPPPPPPLMEAEKPTSNKRKEVSTQPPPVAATGDAHSNLMAAIRQAGGAGRAKLRHADSSTPDKKPATGGDLMADLHAKLSMRRRGISGAEKTGSSILHTLASIIPEPGDQSSPQRSSSEDEWK